MYLATRMSTPTVHMRSVQSTPASVSFNILLLATLNFKVEKAFLQCKYVHSDNKLYSIIYKTPLKFFSGCSVI